MRLCPHCGKSVHKPRSSADHRRFFGVVNAAFNHWPEAHEFQPETAEHLRAWLTAKAGYRETVLVPLAGEDIRFADVLAMAICKAIKTAKGHSFIVVTASGLGVVTPKSIAFDKLDQKAFVPIREAVEEVIKAETGLDPDQLLKEEESAA